MCIHLRLGAYSFGFRHYALLWVQGQTTGFTKIVLSRESLYIIWIAICWGPTGALRMTYGNPHHFEVDFSAEEVQRLDFVSFCFYSLRACFSIIAVVSAPGAALDFDFGWRSGRTLVVRQFFSLQRSYYSCARDDECPAHWEDVG